MEISNQTLITLRDRITANTEGVRELRQEIATANLLKALELGLITRDEVLQNETYQNFKQKVKKR